MILLYFYLLSSPSVAITPPLCCIASYIFVSSIDITFLCILSFKMVQCILNDKKKILWSFASSMTKKIRKQFAYPCHFFNTISSIKSYKWLLQQNLENTSGRFRGFSSPPHPMYFFGGENG